MSDCFKSQLRKHIPNSEFRIPHSFADFFGVEKCRFYAVLRTFLDFGVFGGGFVRFLWLDFWVFLVIFSILLVDF
jgi:hypothetical protein